MAQGRQFERIIKWNHPSHPHPVTESDSLAIYSTYEGKWRCDVCGRVFQGKRAPPSGPERSHRDPGEPDNRYCYHCPRCKFDICTACFKGHLHTFHRHRLKKARTTVVYKSYEGLWHCDACGAVHSEYTQQLCYHCEKCEVDLCNTCFEGKWEHSLHGSDMPDTHKHTLRPINPSIEYRTYQEWICDNCDRRFSCQRDTMTAFHCDECNFDLCKTCHSGYKHPFHPHPVVSVETRQHSRSMFECSNCELPIRQATHYQCVKRTCQYILCVKCFSKQPELHPFHNHPLEVCDPLVTYPQSGGMWHCDRCTENNTNRRQVALSHTEPMYHCSDCEYDLCYSCYSEGRRTRLGPVQVTEVALPTPAPETSDFTSESSGYATYQPYTQATYYTPHDYQLRLSRPLVTGFQSFLPQSPPSLNRLCVLCNRNQATATFIHSGIPHSGRGLCCESCAFDIVSKRRPCPACRIPPDDFFTLP